MLNDVLPLWHLLCSAHRLGGCDEQGKGCDRVHPAVAHGRAGNTALSDLPAARM